jgi:hypothetical protein
MSPPPPPNFRPLGTVAVSHVICIGRRRPAVHPSSCWFSRHHVTVTQGWAMATCGPLPGTGRTFYPSCPRWGAGVRFFLRCLGRKPRPGQRPVGDSDPSATSSAGVTRNVPRCPCESGQDVMVTPSPGFLDILPSIRCSGHLSQRRGRVTWSQNAPQSLWWHKRHRPAAALPRGHARPL